MRGPVVAVATAGRHDHDEPTQRGRGLYVRIQGGELRVRRDDPLLMPYSPGVARIRSAAEGASGRDGLRLLLETSMGDRYRIEVTESEVRLRRR